MGTLNVKRRRKQRRELIVKQSSTETLHVTDKPTDIVSPPESEPSGKVRRLDFLRRRTDGANCGILLSSLCSLPSQPTSSQQGFLWTMRHLKRRT